jgi:hypothetical protein
MSRRRAAQNLSLALRNIDHLASNGFAPFSALDIYDLNFEATTPCKLTKEEKEKIAAEKRNNKDWRPRLGEISSGARLRNLYKGIKGKFAVEEI